VYGGRSYFIPRGAEKTRVLYTVYTMLLYLTVGFYYSAAYIYTFDKRCVTSSPWSNTMIKTQPSSQPYFFVGAIENIQWIVHNNPVHIIRGWNRPGFPVTNRTRHHPRLLLLLCSVYNVRILHVLLHGVPSFFNAPAGLIVFEKKKKIIH
jgi:hypothetical protein